MKRLWLSTVSCLRQHPQLFVPSLVLGLLEFYIGRFQVAFRAAFLGFVFGRKSPTLFNLEGVSPKQVVWATVPITLLIYLLYAALFFSALFLTWKLVRKYILRDCPDSQFQSYALVAVLLAALRGVMAMMEAGAGILLVRPEMQQTTLRYYDLSFAIAGLVLEAFVIAPLILSLLMGEQTRSLKSTRMARIAYFAAGICSWGLLLLLTPLALSHALPSSLEISLLLAKTVSYLPTAVLFVFLSLLSMDSELNEGMRPEVEQATKC